MASVIIILSFLLNLILEFNNYKLVSVLTRTIFDQKDFGLKRLYISS